MKKFDLSTQSKDEIKERAYVVRQVRHSLGKALVATRVGRFSFEDDDRLRDCAVDLLLDYERHLDFVLRRGVG